MKKRVMTFVAACLALSVCAQKNGHTGYPITPVPFTAESERCLLGTTTESQP